MKKLLIHSNNTSFNRIDLFTIEEQFVFDVDFEKDVDFYINDILVEGQLRVALENTDIVFIKVSLSQNYLEYLGLRLAYHIRLTLSLGSKANIPIVFIGEESFQFLGRTYAEPTILFTSGIYLIKETIEDYRKVISWYNDGIIRSLEDVTSFTKTIAISPPANYQSHHSIANEWSVLRWSKVLSIPNDSILENVKKNIESLLYYKYLLAKFPVIVEPEHVRYNILGKGKILYIDDEWQKGWEVVLKKFVFSFPEITFETFKNNFKDKLPKDIVLDCEKEIQRNNPDIVLLDLRLSDSDFSATVKSNELTGYKVLQAIKSLNPGIQVLIFSASNKVWNFIALQNEGADNFILKESPELSVDGEYSKTTLENLADAITVSFKMSFLKKVHLKIKEIISQPVSGEDEEEAEFIIRLKNNLEIAFQLLKETKYSLKYFNHAYLQLFQIIEDFSNLSYIFQDGSDCYVFVNEKGVLVNKTLIDKWESAISMDGGKYKILSKTVSLVDKRKRIDTNYKVSAILIFRYGYPNSSVWDWTEIYTLRNSKAAHFNVESSLDENDILKILNFIKNFISNRKQKETNIDKGLKSKTYEESLEILRNRYTK